MSEESPREPAPEPDGEDRRDRDEAPMRSSGQPLPGDDAPEEPIHES